MSNSSSTTVSRPAGPPAAEVDQHAVVLLDRVAGHVWRVIDAAVAT